MILRVVLLDITLVKLEVKLIKIINNNILEFESDIKYHAIISDPPYGLAFMNKKWDNFRTPLDYQKWVTEWSSRLLDILYPGAICAFFGGTRTYHRLASGLEDSGYEIFDSMIWCYGSGFPKSYNISKGIDKQFLRIGMFEEFAKHYQQQRALKGFTHNYICEVGKFYNNYNHGGASTNWEIGYNVPTLEQWSILQPLLDLSLEFYPLIERVELERIKIGEKSVIDGFIFDGFENGKLSKKNVDITENSSNLATTWNGYGTALKPAYEPIVLCRKPLDKGGYVNSVLKYGTSGLNIDGGRIGTTDNLNGGGYSGNTDKLVKQVYGEYNKLKPNDYIQPLGRFPANFGLICDCEKEPCECVESELDRQSGLLKSGGGNKTNVNSKSYFGLHEPDDLGVRFNVNSGGASRFFYTAKASSKEREVGLDYNNNRNNNHPTVKPIKLIEYLAKLLLPPIDNSSILIPFSGVGSEMIGCHLAGWQNITGIEIDENYVNIANQRLDYWTQFDDYESAMKNKVNLKTSYEGTLTAK